MSAKSEQLSFCKSKLSYMIADDLMGIVIFNISVELSKVIHQWSHTGRDVQYSIYQLTKRDLS